ncbi:MAG: hypothetical protein HYU37_16310 [Acidobacteria bacterium]|nr:hypothetical protein [Acidobacteriota bacterium]
MSTVHLLMVHGVGGHDHLSNLLRTYQSFRANLQSAEAPVLGEDQIPGWRLAQFEEGATPPVLRLEPRLPPPEDGVGAVCMYEVNYSGFAGVVRRNQPLDLTGLFLGLDLAICAARQRPRAPRDPVFGADTNALAACLQRVAGVFTAGTVPIIGAPALLFRNYIGTFVALFTRFFEDIATFVLDKNGEQLISAHLDRTMDTIARGMRAGDRLVIAAHSLGSVVLHNYIVRQWTRGAAPIPDTVITFGSPIGLLVWVWLFLDFEDMDFRRPISADPYFCWNPVSSGTASRQIVSWINVVNSVDPIATAFPVEAVDLSTPAATIAAALTGGAVAHRYFGPDTLTRVGAAHARYLNDKQRFLRILLRASSLASGRLEDVPGARPAAEHWAAVRSVLLRLQWLLFATAVAAIAGYFAVVGAHVADARRWWLAAFYLFPPLTIAILAFFQRLLRGGPTKRITSALIKDMRLDPVSLPYRVRTAWRSMWGQLDVDPMAPSPSYVARLLANIVSFLPTLAAMAAPLVWMTWLTGQPPGWLRSWTDLFGLRALGALTTFMAYVIACAAFEIVRTWRRVVWLLGGAAAVGGQSPSQI